MLSFFLVKRGIVMIILTIIICLAILSGLFWVGLTITGAMLTAFVWLFIKLPVALLIWLLAIACCCTLILIPVGIKLFAAGGKIIL